MPGMDSQEAYDAALQTVQARVAQAASSALPLRIQGGASKAFYASPEQGELLDTRVLHGILSYEPSELYVTVGAGTALRTLEQTLAAQNQCLPFEPPHYAWSKAGDSAATVGGMVASALAGPARVQAGAVRDYVLGLKLLNGQGQLLTFGGQVMKNVAGYDLSRLMVGALGTLGLIAEVSLKVMPCAPAEATLEFEMEQAPALEQLQRWGARPLPLSASCWLRPPGSAPLLRLRLRGALAAVEAACDALLAELRGRRVADAQAQADWVSLRDQALAFFQRPTDASLALWRLSVAPVTPVLDLPGEVLVEWHGALRWVWARADQAERLQAMAQQAGGHAACFVAATQDSGAAPRARLYTANPALQAVQARLKASFDPLSVFNRGLL